MDDFSAEDRALLEAVAVAVENLSRHGSLAANKHLYASLELARLMAKLGIPVPEDVPEKGDLH